MSMMLAAPPVFIHDDGSSSGDDGGNAPVRDKNIMRTLGCALGCTRYEKKEIGTRASYTFWTRRQGRHCFVDRRDKTVMK
jgi:hypothetical protein